MPDLNLGDLEIRSPAFGAHGQIPDRHANSGDDVSPALEWSNVPDGTKELVLICHDPDAPLARGFTHWVVYGIPADAAGIPEGGGDEFTVGSNALGDQKYMGPAPPPDHGPHHYYFWLYALDTELDDSPGLTADQVLDKIDGHIIEQARVVGTYQN